MKKASPVFAILLAVIIYGVGLYICFKYFGFLLLVVSIPLFSIGMLVVTTITQIVLFLLIKHLRSKTHRFMYFFCFGLSVCLVGLYGIIAYAINMLNEIKDALPPELKTEPVENVNPFLNIHLFLILPILIQLALAKTRSNKLKVSTLD